MFYTKLFATRNGMRVGEIYDGSWCMSSNKAMEEESSEELRHEVLREFRKQCVNRGMTAEKANMFDIEIEICEG